ncbi:MAG: thiamine pyrophosphate-binding protein [Candidatus Rokubacteria bacterium]|nr:thiamine pyrophosphate-binding protein [Candidatus Rokubacteria bacterium]
MARTGAHLVVEALLAAGVRHLFSLSGNQILSVYDATIGRPLSIIHTRHEAAAVHMADAWGRLTEEPGVALVTAGPGHCNALSALYGALMAESPVVLLSGHAPAAQAGRGAFQEMDQVGAARPVTKAAWLARDAERLGEDMAAALEIARSGRPGPVHVSLPGDLLEARVGAPSRGAGPRQPAASQDLAGPMGAALALLAQAKRPLILAGPAMARARRWAAVERLSALTGIPALPVESPRGINDPWLHAATNSLGRVDVVLLAGKRLDFALRFGEPPAFSRECRFIQIDAEAPAAPGGRVEVAMCGDPALGLDRMAALAQARTWTHRSWGEEVRAARKSVPGEWESLRRSSSTPMHPLRVCAGIQPLLDQGAVLVVDGGEFGQWAQAGLEAEIRLINGPAGSIGSAIPMALGAKLAHPERQIVAVLGDGTFGFHGFELDTALRAGLPLVAVVGNDARWNAEHQLQLQHYGAERTVGCDLRLSRYDQLATALGGHGEFVEDPVDLDAALSRAVKSRTPACVNVVIDGVAAPTYRASGAAH